MPWKTILTLISFMLLPISALMGISAAVGVPYGEGAEAFRAFGPPIAANTAFLLLMLLLGGARRRGVESFPPRAGLLFVALSWTAASMSGSLPFMLSGRIPSFTDAFFETMSGFTTTGATILGDIESLPRCLLFWRSATHWLGGMGIVVLTVALFPLLGIGGFRLMEAEAPGPSVDRISARISGTAKRLWLVYLGLTVVETVLLMATGQDAFDAATHAFGTMATGGFSPKNASIGHYGNPAAEWIVAVFMLLAGMNFTLHYRALTGRPRAVLRDLEFRVYILVVAAAAGAIAVDLALSGLAAGEAARSAVFQAASVITTTGYATADFALWPAFSQAVLFLLMFVGGCAGSTGGGIKVVRLVALFKMAANELRLATRPRGVFAVVMNGRAVKKNVIYDTAAFVVIYLFLVVAGTVVVSSGGFDTTTSLTATLATLGNIGPGLALVGPMANYGFMPDYILWFLSFLMLAGRLEIFTVFALFLPEFWRKR